MARWKVGASFMLLNSRLAWHSQKPIASFDIFLAYLHYKDAQLTYLVWKMSKLMRLVEDAFFPRDFPTKILSLARLPLEVRCDGVFFLLKFAIFSNIFCYSVPLFAAVSWGGLPCIFFIGVKL